MSLLRRLRYSLTARLLLLFLITSVALAALISYSLRLANRHQFRAVFRPHLVQYLDYIQRDIGYPPNIDRARALTRRLPLIIHIRGPALRWSSDGQAFHPEQIRFHLVGARHGSAVAVGDYQDHFVLRTQHAGYQVFYEIPRSPRHGHLLGIGLVTIVVMLLVVYLCYLGIRWLFRPVADIQTVVRRIGHGDLDYRIAPRQQDELGELAASINAMADEIRRMLDAKRQLLLALSHELRSPLTRARVRLALLQESPAYNTLDGDLAEMEALIGELLEAERLDTRHAVLHRETVALNSLLSDVIDQHFADADVILQPAADDPYVWVDPARIRLLVKNLLANAIRYSPVGQAPRLKATVDQRGIVLTVADQGLGVAPEHLPHLTEPFYRADSARQRSTGGYGLGLYLARLIAEAHGGRLTIASGMGDGTTVRVELPHPGAD